MKASKTVLVRVLFVVLFIAVSATAKAQLKAAFTATPQTGCAPLIVSFADASTGNPSAWAWDLGNGVTSTDQNPTTSYFSPGTYAVKLKVYNGSSSDSVVKTSYITVYQNPVAAFHLLDSTGCLPLKVTYNNKSIPGSGAIANSVWDFGDGNTSNNISPVHSYTSTGTFTVALTVTNTYGCSSTVAEQNAVTVAQGVTAAFAINAANICHAPAAVNFTGTATGSGTLTYAWNFGDNSSATTISPAHNYNKPGNYTVSFTVTSSTGCSDTVSQNLPVSFVHSAISISDSICANKPLQFVNGATPAPASSYWTFGDNTSSDSVSPYKAYTQTGVYNVKVVNVFFAGCADSVFKTITVTTPPLASFTVTDSASCTLPFTTSFTNTSPGNGLSCIWDFGDGTTSTAINPTHQYTQYGYFNVTLKTFNANGCDTSVTKLNAVVIKQVQITGVTGFSGSQCVPATVQAGVTTNVGVSITKYFWNFGDGFTSTSANPTHTYTKAGIFNVTVSIQTAGGCTTSYSLTDSVGNRLVPAFTVSPTNVCASTAVAFNNTTVGNSTFLWWYPGDGDTIYKQPSPSHNYLDTGWFSPMLVVMQNGCYDTLIKKNAVHISGPIASFTDKNNCINKLQVNFTDFSIDDKIRKWSFGDGSTDTAANPVHIYNKPGNYNVSLFVSNNICTFTSTQPVRVVNEKGTISISDSEVCRNARFSIAIPGVNNSNVYNTVWYMGNGTTSSSGGTFAEYGYGLTGKYSFYALVKDVLGCVDTFYAPFKISVFGPTAKLITEETGACKNGVINFADTSTSDGIHSITSWKFNFGDSDTATYSAKGRFSHMYSDTGLFVAKMTVTDNFGCSDSINSSPILITKPYASFKLSDTLVCPGKKVNFTNTTAGDGLMFKWDLGDGSHTTTASPVHLYTVQGTYIPHLYVTDINNCRDTATFAEGINVYIPSASFAMSDSFSSCPPLTVNFANFSKNFSSFQWNFGDGNTSTVQSPEHEYTYPGVYTAKLVLQGNGGCLDSLFKKITIEGPTGTFQYKQNQSCYPFTQKFAAVSSNAVQYLWDYSDGDTKLSTADTSSHLYKPGIYTPKLILIDASGCKVPIIGIDTIKVFSITSRASLDNYLLCDSGKITFRDTSVTDDLIKSSTWTFGDNTGASGTAVTHDYNRTGTYYIKLVDVTAHGCTDTLNLATPVKVVQSPVINIKGATSFCIPATVSLQAAIVNTDTSSLSWSWNFGNGDTSSSQNPSGVVFSNPGTYPVSVKAINTSGCVGSSSANITIHALPAVNAGRDTTVCRNAVVNLQATGAGTYTWVNAPSISCTACSSPIAIPDSTVTYVVTGKDQYGCTATDSVVVKVTQPVKISISNADTLCNGDTKQLIASGAETYQWYPATYLSDATSAQPTFSASKDTSITYSVVGYAANNCFTDTATVKVKVYPIPQMQVVQSSITASAGGTVKLSTINSPDVTKWKWSPAMWLDNPNIADPVAQPRESITYTVVAANDGACVTRAQIAVTVTCSGANIFIPNTFSPNGDGMNDVFYARGTGLYNIKSFRIFNRWGQLVFEKLNTGANSPAEGWDGTIKGKPAPSDVYVYMIEVLCTNDTVVPVKGNITLIR